MQATHKNMLRTILMVIMIVALVYVFVSVFKGKIDSKKEQQRITKTTNQILEYQRNSDRMECNSTIYLKITNENNEIQYIPDESFNEQTIQDNRNNMLERKNKSRTEIFEFNSDGDVSVYSKGVPIISKKNSFTLQKIRSDQWYRYTCENIYCQQTKEGKDNVFSYGFIADTKRIKKIKNYGTEDIDGKLYYKYSFEIVNPLYGSKGEKEEMGYHKLLNRKGLDYMRLKKGYKDVYKLLRDKYDNNSEKIYVWVDEKGAIHQIEKDYTVDYYAQVMQENSEVINSKVGQYGYPEVISRQIYMFSPECARIQIPL